MRFYHFIPIQVQFAKEFLDKMPVRCDSTRFQTKYIVSTHVFYSYLFYEVVKGKILSLDYKTMTEQIYVTNSALFLFVFHYSAIFAPIAMPSSDGIRLVWCQAWQSMLRHVRRTQTTSIWLAVANLTKQQSPGPV